MCVAESVHGHDIASNGAYRGERSSPAAGSAGTRSGAGSLPGRRPPAHARVATEPTPGREAEVAVVAMWDRIKDQAKNLQQQQGRGTGGQGAYGRPGAGPSGHGTGTGSGSGSGSKAQLVGLLKSQLGSLKAELKSGAFRDASMAVCALVAAADGHVDPAERQHVESLVLSDEVLRNFPPEQLRERFGRNVDLLTADFARGRAEVLREVAKAAKKPAEARAVVQIGIVIAGADGYVAPAEEQVLREVCAELGLSPAEFQL